jgi:hypothetical protein
MLTMYDSISVDVIPEGAGAVAGYVNGSWATFASLAEKFPRALLLSVTVNGEAEVIADVVDVETGAYTTAQGVAWAARRAGEGAWRPCVYASASGMGGVLAGLAAGGWNLDAFRFWSAHYGVGAHICGPGSCGAVERGMDGTQWTDAAGGANLDESLLLDDFFGGGDMSLIAAGAEYMVGSIPAGSSTGMWLFADPTVHGKTQQMIRVAVHSASKGYSQVIEVAVNGTTSIAFTEKDVDGVSLARHDGSSNWMPVAFHF